MTQLALNLFGSITAVPTLHLPTDKTRALLAYLACQPDVPQRRETLASLLWPDQPEELARQNLRKTIGRLKQALNKAEPNLAAAVLTITRQTIALHESHTTADVLQFEGHLQAINTHQHAALSECSACLARLEAAVQLIQRGELLAGLSLPDAVPFEEWLLIQREWFHQRRLSTLSLITQAYEQQGARREALRYAQAQIELEPWLEEAHRQAMRILAKEGQRTQALAQYESCRQILQAELGVEPTAETTTLWQQIQAGAFQSTETHATLIHHFPSQLTPFVGRSQALADILTLLKEKSCRVLTLIGPGGIGKTRLSIQVGRLLAEAPAGHNLPTYRDGAFFVPLAAVNDGEGVATAVAQAIGLELAEHIPPRQQLRRYLQNKELLLVGDNCEQIGDGAALIAEITAVAPHVQLLLTSQQALNIQAERRMVITGLNYTAVDETSQTETEAVQFFVRHAQRVAPHFQPTADNLPHLLELCQLLDGMPLALELASGWVRMMDCATIVRETQKNLDFLVSPMGDMPARHQSMRTVLSQSWQLLTPPLQAALQRMAWFAGEFGLDAAVAILPDVSMTDMAALLDKSLVRWRPDGRYHLHPLLRHFVRQQTDASEAKTLFRQRYSHYYLGLVAKLEGALRGMSPRPAMETLQQELDNIRQAWQWAWADEMGALLADCLTGWGRFYHLVGLFEEAQQQLHTAVDKAATWPRNSTTQLVQAHLHNQLSHFGGQNGRYQSAIEHAQQAQALARQLGQAELLADGFCLEGEWRRQVSELDLARQQLEVAVALYPIHGRGFAHAHNQLGLIYHLQSQYEAALSAFEQARQIYETVGDQIEIGVSLGHLAEVYRLKGDYPQALAHGQQALAAAEAIGYQQAIVKHALVVATIQVDLGELDLARTAYQQALETAQTLGYLEGIIQASIYLGNVLTKQSKLKEATDYLQKAYHQAQELGLPHLVALASGKLGIVLVYQGDSDTAVVAYEEAITLWRTLHNQSEFALNLGNLGNIYLRQGDYERARDCFEEALTAVQSIGARQMVANMMMRLGNVYKRLGQYERAIAYFEQILVIYQELQHKSGISTSLGWLGLMQYEMGQYEAAQTHYEQALALAQEMGDQFGTIVWLSNLSEVAMWLGQAELAEQLIQQALTLSRTLGSSRFLPEVLLKQATIFFVHGKYEASRVVLAEALPLCEALNEVQARFDSGLLQARLSAVLGEPTTAVAQLQAMLVEFTAAEHQAQLHYYLWQIGGDTAVWAEAMRLYKALLVRMPNHVLQQQWQTLQAA